MDACLEHIRAADWRPNKVTSEWRPKWQPGYIYAIKQCGPAPMVYIGWAWKSSLSEIMGRAQEYCPYPIEALRTCLRSDALNAKKIYNIVALAAIFAKVRGNWYSLTDEQVTKLFDGAMAAD